MFNGVTTHSPIEFPDKVYVFLDYLDDCIFTNFPVFFIRCCSYTNTLHSSLIRSVYARCNYNIVEQCNLQARSVFSQSSWIYTTTEFFEICIFVSTVEKVPQHFCIISNVDVVVFIVFWEVSFVNYFFLVKCRFVFINGFRVYISVCKLFGKLFINFICWISIIPRHYHSL